MSMRASCCELNPPRWTTADLAVQGALASKFRNMGQTCVCANRILVHDSVYDEFTAKFSEQVRKMRGACIAHEASRHVRVWTNPGAFPRQWGMGLRVGSRRAR